MASRTSMNTTTGCPVRRRIPPPTLAPAAPSPLRPKYASGPTSAYGLTKSMMDGSVTISTAEGCQRFTVAAWTSGGLSRSSPRENRTLNTRTGPTTGSVRGRVLVWCRIAVIASPPPRVTVPTPTPRRAVTVQPGAHGWHGNAGGEASGSGWRRHTNAAAGSRGGVRAAAGGGGGGRGAGRGGTGAGGARGGGRGGGSAGSGGWRGWSRAVRGPGAACVPSPAPPPRPVSGSVAGRGPL